MYLLYHVPGTNWDWSNEKSPEIEVTNVCPNCGSASISSQNNREMISLQTELETTRAELGRAKSKIDTLTKSLHHQAPAKKLVIIVYSSHQRIQTKPRKSLHTIFVKAPVPQMPSFVGFRRKYRVCKRSCTVFYAFFKCFPCPSINFFFFLKPDYEIIYTM